MIIDLIISLVSRGCHIGFHPVNERVVKITVTKRYDNDLIEDFAFQVQRNFENYQEQDEREGILVECLQKMAWKLDDWERKEMEKMT